MTLFEYFLFYDSQRQPADTCPADAITILKASGNLDYQRFRSAILETSEHCFRARHALEAYADGLIEWSSKEKTPTIHYFQGEPTAETIPNSTINILEEPGIRFWIYDIAEQNRAEIWFQFHHMTTDALGSFLFLEEVLKRYAGVPVEEVEMPAEKVFCRNTDVKLTMPLIWCAVKQVFSYIMRMLNPWSRRPLELRSSQADGTTQLSTLIRPKNVSSVSPFPVLFCSLDRESTKKIRQYTHDKNVSLNDLLLTAAFGATARLEKTLPARSSLFFRQPRSIQFAVPISLRKNTSLMKIPLHNVVSVLFVEEHAITCASYRKNAERFLLRIHKKMKSYRDHCRAELLLLELKWLCSLHLGQNRRWGMKRFIQRKTPLATVVLSNLGFLFQFSKLPHTDDGRIVAGTLQIDNCYFASPRTTNATLTIAIGTYAEYLHFGIHPDPKRLTDADVQKFLAFWLEELETYIGSSLVTETLQ